MRVIYIAYGAETLLEQAAVSLLSLARAEGGWPPPFPVQVYTDRPDYFSAFAGHATIEAMPTREMEQWIAAADGYRNIVKCHLLARQTSSFVFLDSDTIVVKPLRELATKLRPGVAYFQRREYRLGRNAGCGKLVAARLPGLGADAWMYNSGLLAVHERDLPALAEAPALAVRLRREFGIGPAEQLADAVVLGKRARIETAASWMVHYWQDKVFFRSFVNRIAGERRWVDWLQVAWRGPDDPFAQLGYRLRPRLYAAAMKWTELRERLARERAVGMGRKR